MEIPIIKNTDQQIGILKLTETEAQKFLEQLIELTPAYLTDGYSKELIQIHLTPKYDNPKC